MTIIQQPAEGGIYFEKNIPDVILQRTQTAAETAMELRINGVLVLSELYAYDTAERIYIRRIGEVVSNYFEVSAKQFPATNFSWQAGLVKSVSMTLITENDSTRTINFSVIKSEASVLMDADMFVKRHFLTRMPSGKRTNWKRREQLSFLRKQAYGIVSINYRVSYLHDGELQEKTGVMPWSIPAVLGVTGDVVSFVCSVPAIVAEAAALPGVRVLLYDIWATGTGFKTSRYTFLVDDMAYRDETNFVFINNFGVLETFTATGNANAERTAEFGMGNIDNHYRKLTQDFIIERTINTGFLSAWEMDWLDDLLRSYSTGIYDQSGITEEVSITDISKTDTVANVLQWFTFVFRRAENNHLLLTAQKFGVFDKTFDKTFE